jgi:hypothetical protein
MYGPKRPPEIQAQIGAEALAARRAGTPWKLLERRFGYSRARLRMLANAAAEVQIAEIATDPVASRT